MINGKYKKKIKEKVEFLWNTAEMINRWCQTKKQEEESSQQTLKMLTHQLTTIDNSDGSDVEDTPNKSKSQTLKLFKNTFKNLVNKDPKDRGKDDFDTKIKCLRNLILRKKQEALEFQKECLDAELLFFGIDQPRDVMKSVEM